MLAELARARARAHRKIGQLEEALEGCEFFTDVHAGLLEAMLARIEAVTVDVDRVSTVIEALLAPYEQQLTQIEEMPGWGRRSGVAADRAAAGLPPESWLRSTLPLDELHLAIGRTRRCRPLSSATQPGNGALTAPINS